MPGNFQRLSRGPWKVTETTARAIIEVAEWWNQHKQDAGWVDPPEYEFEGDIVQVRNDSGYAQNRFAVMGLNGALITDSANLTEFQNYPRFSVVTPVVPTHTGRFCVLIEPIAAGAIGLALVSGVVPVQVNPLAAAALPLFADVIGGQTGYLQESTCGAAQVLWLGAGTGAVWALVRITHPETVVNAVLTANLYACSSAPATILGLNPNLAQFSGGNITINDPFGYVMNALVFQIDSNGNVYVPAGSTVMAKYFFDSGLFIPQTFGEACPAGSSSSSSSSGYPAPTECGVPCPKGLAACAVLVACPGSGSGSGGEATMRWETIGTGWSGTVALAKLTPSTGTNGSLTVVNGIITGYTAPT
jgi:hypothetical protein